MIDDELGKGTQCYLILEHMLNVGPISHREAEQLYGCTRLAARIADLRKKGYNIKSETKHGISARTGFKFHYAEYSLEEN